MTTVHKLINNQCKLVNRTTHDVAYWTHVTGCRYFSTNLQLASMRRAWLQTSEICATSNVRQWVACFIYFIMVSHNSVGSIRHWIRYGTLAGSREYSVLFRSLSVFQCNVMHCTVCILCFKLKIARIALIKKEISK